MTVTVKRGLAWAAALAAAACLALTLATPLSALANETEAAQDAPTAEVLATAAEPISDAADEAVEKPNSIEEAVLLDDSTEDEAGEGELGTQAPDTDEADKPAALKPGWNKAEDGTWRYGLADGSAKTGWVKLKGIWYWLDPANDGVMVTGLQTIGGKNYHFRPSGAMSIGWAKHDGTWYYATSSGALKTGWVKLKNIWYWLEPANGGAMATGLFEAKGEWFTAAQSGAVFLNTWANVDGKRYRVDARGETLTGWLDEAGKTYWLDPELHGACATGFFAVDGVDYCADETGSVLKSQWVEREGVLLLAGSNGALVLEGSQTADGLMRVKAGQGVPTSGWIEAGGCKLYANAGGILATGWIESDEQLFWANAQGITQTGWEKIEGSWYYFDANGAMATGWVKDAGTWYYLAEDGKMLTGWLELGEDKYYLKSNGAMATGTCLIGDQAYRFGNNGKLISIEKQITAKAQTFSSNTDWLILVDTTENKVAVFKGKKGNWNIQHYWTCTSGAPWSPTVKGSFTVGNRGTHFGEEKGYTCWYWTQFCGDYLFHSVLYNPYSKTSIQDGRLGQNLSHGCIRLDIDNAKWIYDNIPRGTKVYVY